MKKIVIGSRGSRLALKQADLVVKLLEPLRLHPSTSSGFRSGQAFAGTEIRAIKTAGDRNQSSPVIDAGGKACLPVGKGIFVTDIEKELLAKKIDIAVHSLKDMSAKVTDGLTIGAYIEAEDRRDVLVSRKGLGLAGLPAASRIGTSSPRRRVQLQLLRSDITAAPIRGNVETRIRKVEDGEYDAVILAYAGLKRLGLEDKITEIFSLEQMLPAPGQGVVAVEARSDDKETLDILARIDNREQRRISEIEFEILQKLGADCTTPVGMNSVLEGDQLTIDIFLSSNNGINYIRKQFKVRCRCEEFSPLKKGDFSHK